MNTPDLPAYFQKQLDAARRAHKLNINQRYPVLDCGSPTGSSVDGKSTMYHELAEMQP
jgi:hypothetical protein